MRVQMGCSLGGEGHLVPLANVGNAFERARHEVLVLVPPALQASAERIGLSYRVGAEPPRAVVDEIWQRLRRGPPDAVAGLIDRELFADRCTEAMLPAARELRDGWHPDLVVREPCEYASAVAAHEAGISLVSIEQVLGEPSYRAAAAGIAAEIAATPTIDEVVGRLR